jgi:hypothetical protein
MQMLHDARGIMQHLGACVTCMDAALHMEPCAAPTFSLGQMVRWGLQRICGC